MIPVLSQVIRDHVVGGSASMSIGIFGAIAEFCRDPDETLVVHSNDPLTVSTSRGAARVHLTEHVQPVAYEIPRARADAWSHGVALCLAETDRCNGRAPVAEFGRDGQAIRESERQHTLFDLGIGGHTIRFCIRTNDAALIALLRDVEGREFLAAGDDVMNAIIDASPHRVVMSALGRIEVYQVIERHKTPEGPHTHVLPKLLASGRTHDAKIPIPAPYLPCLTLYPPNPLVSDSGRARPFDRRSHREFQRMLDAWGVPDYIAEKRRVERMVRAGAEPSAFVLPRSRIARSAVRIALRQLIHDHGAAAVCRRWRADLSL